MLPLLSAYELKYLTFSRLYMFIYIFQTKQIFNYVNKIRTIRGEWASLPVIRLVVHAHVDIRTRHFVFTL